MAYWEIEPSGCCEFKGYIQVRVCTYLEPSDPGYDIHYVYNEETMAWQNNPFHNHFFYIDPDDDEEAIAEDIFTACFAMWSNSEPIQFKHKKLKVKTGDPDKIAKKLDKIIKKWTK